MINYRLGPFSLFPQQDCLKYQELFYWYPFSEQVSKHFRKSGKRLKRCEFLLIRKTIELAKLVFSRVEILVPVSLEVIKAWRM